MLYKTWGGGGALWIVSHLRFYCLGQGICIWGIEKTITEGSKTFPQVSENEFPK